MAFTIYHAYQTPKLVVEDVEERDLGKGLKEITATIANKRMIPTHSGNDLEHKINRPDYAILKGPEVLAGMIVLNKDMKLTREQSYTPQQIEIENIPGMSAITIRWIVTGNTNYSIMIDSEKGGKIRWKEGS